MSETLHAASRIDAALDAPQPPGRRARLALVTAASAIAIGALADGLLRVGDLGVNAPLLVLAVVVIALLLLRERDGDVPREAIGAGAAALLFASMFVWRDSEMLGLSNALAVIASLVLLSLAALRAPLANVRFGTVGEYAQAALRSAGDVLAGAIPLVLRDVELHALADQMRGRRVERIALGLLLALPLLVVFGALFASADAVFGTVVARLVRFDVGVLVSHVLVAGIFTWLAGGWLRGTVLVVREPAIVPGRNRLTLGITEVGIVLGLLDALFALFVAIQLRYFFGGDALVRETAGMTYAEYARQGFFELCWAAALVLPVLLGSRAVLRVERPRDARIHRALSLALVGLVLIVMVSALARLRLYVGAYGWTEDRLFAIAAVGWLATVFAWYVATVMRGRIRGFAFGALASAALVLVQLNIFDPGAWVVTRNRALAESGGRPLDPAYGWAASADAVPAYLPSLPMLDEAARCRAAGALVMRWGGAETDWREWSVARARARAAVREARPSLDRMRASPACPKRAGTPPGAVEAPVEPPVPEATAAPAAPAAASGAAARPAGSGGGS